MKKLIFSVMMVFAMGTAVSFAQGQDKGCGGCKAQCTAQQKAECTDASKKDNKEKKQECTSKTCDKSKKECDKTKKCDKKDAQKKAPCCKKEAVKK